MKKGEFFNKSLTYPFISKQRGGLHFPTNDYLRANFFLSMSDAIKHECGIALLRLKKPMEYYVEKYGSALYGINKLHLLMEKQHNRGQDGAGVANIKFDMEPGQRYISRTRSIAKSQALRGKEMEVAAKLSGARISAQKARLVADQIRGKKVGEALNLLTFSSKKAAAIIKKVLESAVANAEHNEGADVDDLKVSTVFVNEGRSLKRIMPRAKGRADRIVKRSCHITVKVADK